MDGWGISWADVPGHVSYAFIALSYWMTNVFWLRLIAVIGLVFEILYFRMSGGAMHTGIGWDIIFIGINLYQIYRLVADQRALRYMKQLHLLSQGESMFLRDPHKILFRQHRPNTDTKL